MLRSDPPAAAADAGVERFDLSAHSTKLAKNRRQKTYVSLGLGFFFLAIWGAFVAVDGFPPRGSQLVPSLYLLLFSAIFFVSATGLARAREPVALLVRPEALAFQFADRSEKSFPWDSPRFDVRLFDQREVPPKRQYSELSPFVGSFSGLPAASRLVPLPESAFTLITDRARNRGLAVDSWVSSGGRREPPAGTRVSRLHRA
jgi:hypothetical protein